MGDIAYRFYGKLYLNLTNKCSCNCEFCIRKNGDGVGNADNLWLGKEPSYEEILDAIENERVSEGEEIIFCGYGEPTCAFAMLLRVAEYLKERYQAILRVNTNGQGNLIAGKNIVPELKGKIDVISISLNASDAKKYQAIVHSVYGETVYGAVLNFASACKEAGIQVYFTVVDVIGETEVEKCQKVAERLGIPLRVRTYVENNDEYSRYKF